jgi:lipoyl(octanoyl) transferase
MPYDQALYIQYRLLEKRRNDEIDNTLLLLEHPPVLTLGTRGQYNNIYISDEELKKEGVTVFKVNRGGDVTYHGPGQIVGYLIFDLKDFGRDIRLFIQKIEQCFIVLMQYEYNIHAYGYTDKYTGVWINDKKITAIGISVTKWITMHGFAFNVNTNLDHFNWINPCGLSKGVTSIEKLTGKEADMNEVLEKVQHYFVKEFAFEVYNTDLNELL